MKIIIALGGFAQVGKSTAVNYLEDKYDLPIISTSDLLHKFSSTLLNIDSKGVDKNKPFDMGTSNYAPFETYRDFLIWLAEDVIVPVFGRQAFVNSAISKVIEEFNGGHGVVVFETIGGVEYDLFVEKAELLNCKIINVNIIRDSNSAALDSRKLLDNAIDIYNNGSIEDLYCKLDILVSTLKHFCE